MADLKKTIDIILNGEDKASRHIKNVNSSMGKLGSRFASIAKTSAVAATAIAAVGTAVAALISAGLKEAYNQAVQFESAMVDLEKVLGDHPEQLTEAKAAAMDLSAQYGISSGEIVDSIANWVQAGYDIEEATKLAEESIALMYTSELDAAAATTTLTKIMKGFGLEVSDARSKLDVANEISNNYASSVGQLTEAMGRVAPIADAMGLSFEEVSSFLVPAIEKFQDGQRVGTAFAKILNNLVSDTGRVSDGLETLGVSQRDANGELRSGKDILYDVAAAFQDIEPGQKTFVAQQIAGAEHSAKFLATMNSFDQVEAVYNTAMESAGSVTEELAAQLAAAQKQLDRWDTSWENLSVTVGDQFKAAATEAVKGGTDIVNALRDSIEGGEMDEVFDVLEENLTAFGEELVAIADTMPEALEGIDWSAVEAAINTAGDAISGLFGGLDLTKAEDLERAIQGIVDTSGNLVEFTGNMITVLEKLGGAFVWTAELVNDFFEILRDIDGPADYFKTAAGLIVGAMEGIFEKLSKIPVIGKKYEPMVEDLEELGEAIAGMTIEADEGTDKIDKMNASLNDLPSKKSTEIELYPTGAMADAIHGDEGVVIPVNVDDKGSTKETSDDIDDLAKKKLEIDADIRTAEIERDIAKIEATADTMQTAVEWEAKLDIAEAEASARKMEAVMDSVGTAIESTGQSIGDAMSALSDENLSTLDKWAIEEYFDAEAERRAEAFEQQKQLVEQQIKLNDLKIDRMESGEAMMQISVDDSVEPALKLVMMNILELMQTEFNESASEFLMGWESVS